jgi:very-short-patch-repair endonuclease
VIHRRPRAPSVLWQALQPAAQKMRHALTPAEDRLWQRLRRKDLGVKFRRQHVIARFVVDFYCPQADLAVEVDGASHTDPARDAERQEYLEALGLRVLRFTNSDVELRLEEVIASISTAIAESRKRGAKRE